MSTPVEVPGQSVVSNDGTRIAYEQLGSGPAVILVASALADRKDTSRLAKLLAQDFTVVNYDRRGRGASSDAAVYDVEREAEDIAALIEAIGGSASLFGSSSGAVLALRAAAAALPVERLALYEPPFVVSHEDDFGPGDGFAERITALLDDERRSQAVKLFMTEAQGMPNALVTMMRLMPGVWKKLTAMADTLPYDIAVMGDTQQAKPLRTDHWSGVSAPTLVFTGGKSPEGFHAAGRALAGVLSNAQHRVVDGLSHGSVVTAPKKVAPILAEFLRG